MINERNSSRLQIHTDLSEGIILGLHLSCFAECFNSYFQTNRSWCILAQGFALKIWKTSASTIQVPWQIQWPTLTSGAKDTHALASRRDNLILYYMCACFWQMNHSKCVKWCGAAVSADSTALLCPLWLCLGMRSTALASGNATQHVFYPCFLTFKVPEWIQATSHNNDTFSLHN